MPKPKEKPTIIYNREALRSPNPGEAHLRGAQVINPQRRPESLGAGGFDCLADPQWIGWLVNPQRCRDEVDIHCGRPSPCGSSQIGFGTDPQIYCEETVHVEPGFNGQGIWEGFTKLEPELEGGPGLPPIGPSQPPNKIPPSDQAQQGDTIPPDISIPGGGPQFIIDPDLDERLRLKKNRYGPRLHTATHRLELHDGVQTDGQQRKVAVGYLYPDGNTLYGPELKSASGVSCGNKGGEGLDFMLPQCREAFTNDTTIGTCQMSKGETTRISKGGPFPNLYGEQIAWTGPVQCMPEENDPAYWSAAPFEEGCTYCPEFLWTVGYPCFGSSYDYHWIVPGAVCPPDITGLCDNCCGIPDTCCLPSLCRTGPFIPIEDTECDGCFADKPENHALGLPICEGGEIEECEHIFECAKRNAIGALVGAVLFYTRAFERIPLQPIRERISDEGPQCNKECGSWGWELKGNQPHKLDPQGCNVEQSGSGEPNTIFNDTFSRQLPDVCGDLDCCCVPECNVHCTGSWNVYWDAASTANAIEEAHICFSQNQICDPGAHGPPGEYNCPNSPCVYGHPDPDRACGPCNYSNPSSQIVVNVHAFLKVRIRLKILDCIDQSEFGCGCCNNCAEGPGGGSLETLDVVVTGRYDGPMLWGDVGTRWGGFTNISTPSIGEGIDYGWQQGSVNCVGDPFVAQPRQACMAPFVHHGKWTDFLGSPGQAIFSNPPKQCPDFVVRDPESDCPNDQFFCPPLLRWTWNQGNRVDYSPQCWDVEALRINDRNCPLGSDVIAGEGSHRYECTKPECRRGCTIGNSVREYVAGCSIPGDCDLQPNGRHQPCFSNCDPIVGPSAVPWACGHCR